MKRKKTAPPVQDNTKDVKVNLADYGLSPDDLDRDIVYHYSRERRLARAPQKVRDWNTELNEQPKKRGMITGLFTSLTDTRSKRFTFFTIIALCVIMIILKFFR
jgi:hypothetical protein